MHCVANSIFFTVAIPQYWVGLKVSQRLFEWKASIELAWYAVCPCASLDRDAISNYFSTESDSVG
jgi:hypothetical protein